jgi:hypothetical protein
MEMADYLLRYIASTKELGITLNSANGVIAYAWVDCSYASHPDKKSHTGVKISIGLNGGSVISVSEKHTITADSSCAAEYIGVNKAAQLIAWIRDFLGEMGYEQCSPTVCFEDNKSTIATVNKRCNGKRTRHLDIKYRYSNEQVEIKKMIMQYLETDAMPPDMLTKNLPPSQFIPKRREMLGYVYSG